MVFLIALAFQAFAINRLVNLDDFQQVANLPDNFPINITISIITAFQLFINIVNVIITSVFLN